MNWIVWVWLHKSTENIYTQLETLAAPLCPHMYDKYTPQLLN